MKNSKSNNQWGKLSEGKDSTLTITPQPIGIIDFSNTNNI